MTLNDFIEKKERDFNNHFRHMEGGGLEDVLPFIRSALRECAEETIEAVTPSGTDVSGKLVSSLDYPRSKLWLGTNDQPNA